MIPPGLQWVHDELANWARWGREPVGPQAIPEPAIWDAWLSYKGRAAGWGLTQAQKEAEARGETVLVDEAPSTYDIDEAWAQLADRRLNRLTVVDRPAFVALHRYFYRWSTVSELVLHAAMRHYADLVDSAWMQFYATGQGPCALRAAPVAAFAYVRYETKGTQCPRPQR